MDQGAKKLASDTEDTQKFIKDIKNSVNNDIFEQFLKKNNARFNVDDEEGSQESSGEEDSNDENFNEEDFEALMQGAGRPHKIWRARRSWWPRSSRT